jgi:hypothetical protein
MMTAPDLSSIDWSTAAVDPGGQRRPKVVHSARIPADLSERLEAEATRRGVTPSALICELVAAGLTNTAHDEPIPIRPSQLHRLVESLVREASDAA